MTNLSARLRQLGIKPDPIKDQFFLISPKIVDQIIQAADLVPADVVLEIGAGTGVLTYELAKRVKTVIAFEIDPRFRPFLRNLPNNVDLYYKNAWEYVQLRGKFRKTREFNKIVSNLPYSFIEPLLHNLTFLEYDKVVLMIPIKSLKTIKTKPIFASFFDPQVLFKVPKANFYPKPSTDSVVIDLKKLPDPITTENLPLFLRQYIYQHEKQLVKNSLREGLIHFYRLVFNQSLTKNQAREIIKSKNIKPSLLDRPPDNQEIYHIIEQIFK